jgi:hypothetical protein
MRNDESLHAELDTIIKAAIKYFFSFFVDQNQLKGHLSGFIL